MANENEIVTCTTAEMRAMIREREQAAVQAFTKGIGAKVRESTGYYSTVRFQIFATQTVVGPPAQFDLTIKAGERQAFAYKIGDNSPEIAGYIQPVPGPQFAAGLPETNLSQAKSTRNGESFIVTGISCFIREASDAVFARLIWQNCSVEAVINDTTRRPLGPLTFFPALSSLNGSGLSFNVAGGPQAQLGFISETMRGSEGTRTAFDLAAAPIIWRPNGEVDGSLYLAINLPRDILVPQIERIAVPPLVDAFAPIAITNSPPMGLDAVSKVVQPFTFVDITFRMDGNSLAKLSENQ